MHCLIDGASSVDKGTFREVGVVVPNSVAGRIIGKGGSNISKLREGCERCDMTPLDDTDKRVLVIAGDILQITRTMRQVRLITQRSSFFFFL